jgi:hypothetical protein
MLKRVTTIIDPEDIDLNTSMVIVNAAHFKVTIICLTILEQ